ncbi:DUF6408 family protein [Streptomyces tubbatahanensis]
MDPIVEYRSARCVRIRRVLRDIAMQTATNLLAAGLVAVVTRLL